MAVDMKRSLALRILWENYGALYRWGGDDPTSWDCSGLMIEVLQSVGLFPRDQDTTADGLFRYFHMQEVPLADLEVGCLVFWLTRDGGKAVHVEMVVQVDEDNVYCMGASGGGSRTQTADDAVAQNAYVKIRPMASRKGQKAFVNPFKEVRRDA